MLLCIVRVYKYPKHGMVPHRETHVSGLIYPRRLSCTGVKTLGQKLHRVIRKHLQAVIYPLARCHNKANDRLALCTPHPDSGAVYPCLTVKTWSRQTLVHL